MNNAFDIWEFIHLRYFTVYCEDSLKFGFEEVKYHNSLLPIKGDAYLQTNTGPQVNCTCSRAYRVSTILILDILIIRVIKIKFYKHRTYVYIVFLYP